MTNKGIRARSLALNISTKGKKNKNMVHSGLSEWFLFKDLSDKPECTILLDIKP